MSAAADLATASRHSSDSPDWMTPEPIVELARATMGGIDLDPASDAEANKIVKATRFYTEAVNGLLMPWWGNVFLNPPGGKVAAFWRALLLSYGSALPPNSVTHAIWIGYSLEQLQTLQVQANVSPLNFPICVPKTRIAFVENAAMKAARIARLLAKGDAEGASAAARKTAARIREGKEPPNSPSHANYITYIGKNVDRFEQVFSAIGKVRR